MKVNVRVVVVVLRGKEGDGMNECGGSLWKRGEWGKGRVRLPQGGPVELTVGERESEMRVRMRGLKVGDVFGRDEMMRMRKFWRRFSRSRQISAS